MKTTLIKYFTFVTTCVALMACTNSNPPEPDEMPEFKLAIIKMGPEMRNSIFVSPVVDSATIDYSKTNLTTLHYGNVLVLNNPTTLDNELAQFAQSELNIVGTNPYLHLDNDYVIIDWKWYQFHPLSGEGRRPLHFNAKSSSRAEYSTNRFYNNGIIANEEYYLLSTPWNNLSSLTAEWTLDEGTRIEMPEIRYIDCVKIEKYGKFENSINEIIHKYNIVDFPGLFKLYSDNPEMGKACVEEFCAMQVAYVKTLNEMINNKDFETWTIQR